MTDRLVIHIGTHKTATTSLQSFLGQRQKALLQCGVRYIPLKQMRSDVTPLICNLSGSSRRALAGLIDAMPQRTLLLSDENILGGSGDIPSGALYIYARNRIEMLCEEQSNRTVDIVLAIRSPGSFITSMYSEHIRHSTFIDFDDYISVFDVGSLSYARTFSWIFDLPEHVRVHVLPFEPALGGGVHRIAHTVLRLACENEGIELGPFPETRSRASFTVEELRLAARIAREADPRTAQMFLNMLDARDKRFGSERFSPLPADLLNRLDHVYREDVTAMTASR